MLKIGDKAPDFTLTDQDGKARRLSDFVKDKVLVLYFYPKDETAGCIMEACSFRDAYEDFREAGAEVVGVSSDSVQSHKDFAGNHKLPFVLLSDPDMQVQGLYGADSGFMGLFKSRISFVIDQKGVVRHVFSSIVQPKKHARETLEALEKIREIGVKGG